MVAYGPRVVDLGTPEQPATPPFHLIDNEHTLLRETDLVIMDAMSTGYSRVVDGHDPNEWHGWSKDVELVSELIRLWVTRYGRWGVRFIFLASRMEPSEPSVLRNGCRTPSRCTSTASSWCRRFSTLVLKISRTSPGIGRASVFFPPTRQTPITTATMPIALEDVLDEAEGFADGPYRKALAAGHRLDPADRAQVVATVSRLTGLDVNYIERADLRIEHVRFCTELLRSKGKAVGRIDGRYTGALPRRTYEVADTDPSGDDTVAIFVHGF